MEGVGQEVIWLRIFPFFLRDINKAWLQSLSLNSIMKWNELKIEFRTDIFRQEKFPSLETR